MSEWISVDDRLPTEEDGYVWIFDPGPTGEVMGPFIWSYVDPKDGDTHWMPTGLTEPEPPQ